ncbi:MAG: hypothetical protein LBL04_15430 [Bacteroidales bacterium]|nr:hypothetical protein [Bacteroidales bacterium]
MVKQRGTVMTPGWSGKVGDLAVFRQGKGKTCRRWRSLYGRWWRFGTQENSPGCISSCKTGISSRSLHALPNNYSAVCRDVTPLYRIYH